MTQIPDGLYLINKRKNYTSQNELSYLKKKFSLKKIGHAGTLDKFASGLLIIGIGAYTRLLDLFLKLDKVYLFTVDYSILTDTLDPEGELLQSFLSFDPLDLKNIHRDFLGLQLQQPPLYSALKVEGKRLSDLARKEKKHNGEQGNSALLSQKMSKKKREIEIYSLRKLTESLSLPKSQAGYMLHCSSGTYVRSLARDMGRKVDAGGTTVCLQRRRIGSWHLRHAANPEILKRLNFSSYRIKDASLQEFFNYAVLKNSFLDRLKYGQIPENDDFQRISILNDGAEILIFDENEMILGMAYQELRKPDGVEKRILLRKTQKNDLQKKALSGKLTRLKVFHTN